MHGGYWATCNTPNLVGLFFLQIASALGEASQSGMIFISKGFVFLHKQKTADRCLRFLPWHQLVQTIPTFSKPCPLKGEGQREAKMVNFNQRCKKSKWWRSIEPVMRSCYICLNQRFEFASFLACPQRAKSK